jgi:hypothetical protein
VLQPERRTKPAPWRGAPQCSPKRTWAEKTGEAHHCISKQRPKSACLGSATALSSSNRPFIQQPPFPYNGPLLFVIPRVTEGSAVRHSCARPYRPTTSTNHHQILMEAPTSPLSFRVSRRGPRNCRSLGYPRDDKKGRVVARQGRLLDERAVALSLPLPCSGRRQVIKLTYDQKSLSHISGSSL